MGAAIKTPYEILGVSQNADVQQFRAAFRHHIHALKQGKLSPCVFCGVCRAYETLSDYDKRKSYDETKNWISKLTVESYTLQQLAAEPNRLTNLKHRVNNSTLREINAQDPITGHTILYCAARVGNYAAVLYLIEQGAEPDLSQRTKSTALHVSAFYGHPDVVRCLLESGADYRIKNSFNNTADAEAYDDDVKRIFADLKQTPFVQAAADQLDWFKNNMNGLNHHIDEQYYVQRQTLLHCASKKVYLDLVRWLVEERSAVLDIVDINLNSALHLAAYGGHASIVEYLLDRGANSLLINKWNMTAEQEGKHYDNVIIEIFERMRKRDMFEMAMNGVDWWFRYHFGNNSPDTIDAKGTSLLYIACRYGQTTIAKWLLEHGANINVQLQMGTGSAPLHGAAFHGHVSTVELLLAHGADVNIKNNYGANVFDESNSDAVKNLLEQYRRNLNEDKLIPVHVYAEKLGENDTHEPIAKVYLRHDAKRDDLLQALPETLRNQNSYLAIAQRPLRFEKENTTVLAAVCSARYAQTKFIEIPLRLTLSTATPHVQNINRDDRLRNDSTINLATFEKNFEKQSQSLFLDVKVSLSTEQTFRVGDLFFSVAAGSSDYDVSIEVKYLNSPNFQRYGLLQCLCLFKTAYSMRSRLREPPTVSFLSESNARLYTLGTPAPYWFTHDTNHKRLPMVGGMHAFFRHIDIIPALLSLPADMFLAAAVERPLVSRTNPVPCQCLELRKHNVDSFPLIAYHGTHIDLVRSILMDGLVIPGTVVAEGLRVKPPAHHIPLYRNVSNIVNFAGAIFVSPSIHYSSDPIYAVSFEYMGTQWLPVLECSVKREAYKPHHCTVQNYVVHPNDDIHNIEWRIEDPTNIEINAVLFIVKEFDQRKKK